MATSCTQPKVHCGVAKVHCSVVTQPKGRQEPVARNPSPLFWGTRRPYKNLDFYEKSTFCLLPYIIILLYYNSRWLLMITYDGWRRLKMLFWAIRASQPTKSCENKTVCVFFKARLMVMLPDVEIPLKRQKITKNWIEKIDFFKMKNPWKNHLTIFPGCSFPC